MGDFWDDIPIAAGNERLGYPTQKPQALLKRIIAASTNPGDLVLDPFCGCGTAIHAAESLERRWIGIDITYLAIGLIEQRLRDSFPGIQFDVVGEPCGLMDAEHLAASQPHQFQFWIVRKIGGTPYRGGRKGPDRGIDGYVFYTKNEIGAGKSAMAAAIVSIKAGKNVGVAMIRDLKGTMARERADIGIFICVRGPSREMQREAACAGFWTDPVTGVSYSRLQIFTLEDVLGGQRPRIPLLDRQVGLRKAKREDRANQPGLYDLPNGNSDLNSDPKARRRAQRRTPKPEDE